MGQMRILRLLAIIATFYLVTALPQNPSFYDDGVVREVERIPSPWVTVGSSGAVQTISPLVITTNGAATTISAPPMSLTQTNTWTLTVDGHVITSTGRNPVAMATGSSEAGSFVVCDNPQGQDAPFCQPRTGSELAPGHFYYITWDSTRFASGNTTVQIQGIYGNGKGFVSQYMPASEGFYSWAINPGIMQNRGSSTLNATLFVATVVLEGNKRARVFKDRGPIVFITSNTLENGSGGAAGTSALTIALPVICGIILIAALAACVVYWRHRGRLTGSGLFGGLSRRLSGYGARQSQAQRVEGTAADDLKSSGGGGIQLNTIDSRSPTRQSESGKRNVFREEMERQDRERVKL